MRARQGLALALLELGEEEAAMEHFRAMLKLNPGDNQGIRYLLLGSLLRRDDIPALETLLADYADEWSAYWLYTRALVAYRKGQGSVPATLKLLRDADPRTSTFPPFSPAPPPDAFQNRLRYGRRSRRSRPIRARMRRRMAENARSDRMADNCDRRRQRN